MMILNAADEDLKILNESAPQMVPKFLKKDSKAHHTKFVEYLDLLEVPYSLDHTLV
jgi:histidyl-tRNA synthetase